MTTENATYPSWMAGGRPSWMGAGRSPWETWKANMLFLPNLFQQLFGGSSPEQQTWWSMKPKEQEKAYLDLSREPYPAPKGFRWETITYDPQTQQPTQPRWNLAMDEGEEGDIEEQLRQMMLDVQKRIAGMWEMGVPGGGEYGELVTRSDGSTGYWVQDPSSGIPQFISLTSPTAEEGVTPWQQTQMDWWQQQAAQEQDWNERQLKWQQEQWQQQQEMLRQQRLAELAANPQSWLQYAAEAGQQATIQPWMMPLMAGQYPSLQAGQPIPGFQGTEGMTEMPELTRPSMQYWGRMGPTGQAQYAGYKKARTGQTPAETEFRQWSTAPPTGAWAPFRYGRG